MQPLAVMGYSPGDVFPGVNNLSQRRRLLMGFLNQPLLRVDNRVPLSMQEINRSYDALVTCAVVAGGTMEKDPVTWLAKKRGPIKNFA